MDRYVVLENGMVFKGKAFGADKEVIAELVFTTGMTAYIETLTDPSFYRPSCRQSLCWAITALWPQMQKAR